MKQEDWIKQLRDKLADYEEPAPADLWAGIEARLTASNNQPVRRVLLWGRWAVAAAFVGLLLGSGYLMWSGGGENLIMKETSLELARKKQPKENLEKRDYPKEQENIVLSPKMEKVVALRQKLQKPQVISVYPEITDNQEKQVSQESSKTQDVSSQPTPSQTSADIHEIDAKIAEIKRQRHNHVGFSLYASNSFGNQVSRNGVLMSHSQLANYNYTIGQAQTRSDETVYLYNYEERQKHYQPISFGLTVNIPISSGFSVSTGAVYTRLRSDFVKVMNGYPFEQEQTLYYVGIPLSAQYRLWQLGGLNVYVSAGGQVDFNVKTKFISGDTEIQYDRDCAQWSVQGALGLQYDIIPQLGVYAEPGVKFYFDNGSKVRNFFKDKPTNFNLQLGLRLNL